MSETTNVTFDASSEIAAYSEFRAQLAQLDSENKSLVFDYESPKGNKDARSHIHKLRRTKSAVDAARKEEKAASLAYGRRVDSEAKEIIAQLESMISVHESPLKEIEEREAARKQEILSRLGVICGYSEISRDLPAEELKAHLAALHEIAVDESFGESMAAATTSKKESIAHLEDAIKAAEKREAEAADLARLRAEAEAREREEREQRIAEEAAAKAKAEAEEKSANEKKQAAAREAAAKQRAEDAEREAQEAIKRAAEAEKNAKAKAEQAIKDKAKKEAAEAAAREKDKEHRAAINNAAVDALISGAGLDANAAKAAITLIAKGGVPAVVISY